MPRRLEGLAVLLIGLLTATGCESVDSRVERELIPLVLAASDTLLPIDFEGMELHISTIWGPGYLEEVPISVDVIEATGLTPIGVEEIRAARESTAVLIPDRPRWESLDSVQLVVSFTMFEVDRWWSRDISFVADCTDACSLTESVAMGWSHGGEP